MAQLLADLPLSELWEIANNLGIGGKQVTDKPYVIKLIKQRRAALEQAGARQVSDAASAQASRRATSDYVQPQDLAPEGEAVDYDSMEKADLEALAAERGLQVTGTGSGGNVVKADLVKALRA